MPIADRMPMQAIIISYYNWLTNHWRRQQ